MAKTKTRHCEESVGQRCKLVFKSQSFGLPRFSGENVVITDKIDCFVLYAMTLFIKKVRQCLIHQFLCTTLHFLGYPVMGNWLARVLWKSVKKIAKAIFSLSYLCKAAGGPCSIYNFFIFPSFKVPKS